MIYKFECGACKQRISASLDSFGTTAKCPACGVTLVLPSPSNADFERLAELVTSFDDSPDKTGEAGLAKSPTPRIFKFQCGICGQRMSATPDQFGSTNHCPSCEAEFIVPTP